MKSRRSFLKQATVLAAGVPLLANWSNSNNELIVMTVNGAVKPQDLAFTLLHEHVLVDFIGAEKYSRDRYNPDEVFTSALPHLNELKRRGCRTFIDCTPAYLGRDAGLLKRLADASGLNIITNTGYYGAAQEKYLPKQVYTESADQIASHWIAEWKNGIDGTGIRPGFIKTGVDKAPLSATQRKVIEAAAIAHLATGLTVAIHTGDGEANLAEMKIFKQHGVSPAARIWVHAQNETNLNYHVKAAKAQSWVSFDNVNVKNIDQATGFIQTMKSNNLLHRVLLSHDSGWYHVGEPNGGTYNDYNAISDVLIPALKKKKFTQEEIDMLFIKNPASAFTVNVRKM